MSCYLKYKFSLGHSEESNLVLLIRMIISRSNRCEFEETLKKLIFLASKVVCYTLWRPNFFRGFFRSFHKYRAVTWQNNNFQNTCFDRTSFDSCFCLIQSIYNACSLNLRTVLVPEIKKVFVRKVSPEKICFARTNSISGNPPLKPNHNQHIIKICQKS